jgi:hypothetical protein
MTVLYKFKGRLRFETEAEAEKYCRELQTNVFSIFWRTDPDYGLRRVYLEGKNLCFDAEIYGTEFAFSDTLKMIKDIAITAKSGRIRIYEDEEFQEIIPSVVRLEKKKLDDYSAYLKSLGKDVLDNRKINYVAQKDNLK